jgi:hypothetical protein
LVSGGSAQRATTGYRLISLREFGEWERSATWWMNAKGKLPFETKAVRSKEPHR